MSDEWTSPEVSFRSDIDGTYMMIAGPDQPNRFAWRVTTYGVDGSVHWADQEPERGDRITGPTRFWDAEEACWAVGRGDRIEITVPGYGQPFIV